MTKYSFKYGTKSGKLGDEGVLVTNKTQTHWRCDPECEHHYEKTFVADDWVLQVTSSSAVVPYEVI